MKDLNADRTPDHFHDAFHVSGKDNAYCLRCGNFMQKKILPGEERPRLVCLACGFIFYQNPKVVVAAIPEWQGKAVLVRRGIEPRLGTWSYPGGFLELGESVEEGAIRETKEETNLDIEIRSLLNIYSRPEAGVIVLVYMADVIGGQPTTCMEVTEIGRFAPVEIPWNDLAFPSTEWALRDWLAKRDGLNGP